MTRGVVTYTQLTQAYKTRTLAISDPYYPLNRMHTTAQQLTFTKKVNTACDGKGMCLVHTGSGNINNSWYGKCGD
jgi:hypothetical protein